MSRLDKIKEIFTEKLKKHIKQQENIDISEIKMFNIIQDADCSNNKKNVRWIIETLLNDGFLWEDILPGKNSKVYETIELFEKNKIKLPVEQRSLMNYKTLGDLWTAVEDFENVLTTQEEKEIAKEIAQKDTEYLYEDENIKIVSPLTQFSAQWWGKGTRWCTSANKNNMFERYATQAPLLIILMSNGDKLQLWKNGNNIQFMNEADKIVEKDYIKEHWTVLEPICSWLNDLRFIPEEYLTTEICEKILEEDHEKFKEIPINLLTQEMCNNIFNKNHYMNTLIPEKFLQQNHIDFLRKNKQYIYPLKYITQADIEDILINQLSYRYLNILKDKLDKNMVTSILKNPEINIVHLLHVLKDNDIIFDNVFYENIWKKHTWRVYPVLPKQYKTKDKTDNYLINAYQVMFYELPEEQRTMNNFKKILNHNDYKTMYKYNGLNLVNDISIKDKDFILQYLEITSNIESVPKEIILEKHVDEYRDFIIKNVENIKNIPMEYLNEKRLLDYLTINNTSIVFIPKEHYTKKILLKSNLNVLTYDEMLNILNKNLLDDDVIKHLIINNLSDKIEFVADNTDFFKDINNIISSKIIEEHMIMLSGEKIKKIFTEDKLIYLIQNGYGKNLLKRLLNNDAVDLITEKVVNELLKNQDCYINHEIQQEINFLVSNNALLKPLQQKDVFIDEDDYNAHLKIYNVDKIDTFNQEVVEPLFQKKKDLFIK